MANVSLQQKRDSKRWVERAGSLLCVNFILNCNIKSDSRA